MPAAASLWKGKTGWSFPGKIVLEPKNAGGISFQILEENQIVFFFQSLIESIPTFPNQQVIKD